MPARTAHPNIEAATAWTQHQLIFKGTALRDVAGEFNRYNARRLVIGDPQLADLKITGIFSSADPSSFIRFLEGRPDIAVTQTGSEIIVSRK
jgi:transmembrane sensor